MKVSIVIPIYNEEDNIEKLIRQIQQVISKIDVNYEILCVDDGSGDNSFKILKNLAENGNYKIKAFKLTKNFGKSTALNIGFKNATGDIIITMDADLQDDPKEIPRFIEEIKKGYDIVTGWKFERKDPLTKKVSSKLYNLVTSWISGLKLHDFNCGFKAYRSKIVKNMHIHGDLHRYILVMSNWKGYTIKEIKVDHHPRNAGQSKYGIGRLIVGFIDLIKISFIHFFKNRPLYLFGTSGLIMISLGLVFSLFLLIQFLRSLAVATRPLMIIIAILFILGFQLIALGLLGELISENSKLEDDSQIIKEVI